MRPLLALAAALLVVGCGGDDRYAGLTEEQAAREVVVALEAARRDGTLPAELSPEPSAEEAMGRAGGSALGAAEQLFVPVDPVARGVAPAGDPPAWVASFRPDRVAPATVLCVYVWKDGSELALC